MAKTYDGAGQDYTHGKYIVEKHMYPSDLDAVENNQYGGHKVVFYINVAGGGKISKSDEGMSTIAMPEARFGEFAGEIVAGDIAKHTEITVGSPKRRLTTAICLYVPESLTKSYSVNWGIESSNSMVNSAAMAQVALGLKNNNAVGVAGDVIKELAGKALLEKSAYAQKSVGVGPGNSKAEFLFSGVDFGSFTFDYRFAPRSSEEAANVLNIVRTFRHHMLPEFYGDANFLYIYPSEFDVRYYIKDKENDFLERHMTAVLKGMNINYTSNNQMTTFADGMPTHINITLQFQELAMPSKETSPADRPGA